MLDEGQSYSQVGARRRSSRAGFVLDVAGDGIGYDFVMLPISPFDLPKMRHHSSLSCATSDFVHGTSSMGSTSGHLHGAWFTGCCASQALYEQARHRRLETNQRFIVTQPSGKAGWPKTAREGASGSVLHR